MFLRAGAGRGAVLVMRSPRRESSLAASPWTAGGMSRPMRWHGGGGSCMAKNIFYATTCLFFFNCFGWQLLIHVHERNLEVCFMGFPTHKVAF